MYWGYHGAKASSRELDTTARDPSGIHAGTADGTLVVPTYSQIHDELVQLCKRMRLVEGQTKFPNRPMQSTFETKHTTGSTFWRIGDAEVG